MRWITGKIVRKKAGKDHKDVVIADGLFIPRQQSDQWAVWETGEDSSPMQMLQYMQESESVVVGWIHSHPTFDAFLSSVDQHTHFMLQRELPLAFAIVVDKEKKPRVMRLSPAGLEVVAACGEHGAGFHEHSLSNEEMVVDVPYFIHHHAKLSKLAFFDNNSFKEILGKNNTILTIKRHYIQKFLQPPWGRFSHNQSLVFIKTLIK
jgi:proteasome lid subunit RPN8/RPN11